MWPLLDEGLFSWFKITTERLLSYSWNVISPHTQSPAYVHERNEMLSDALMLSKASELAMHLQIDR